MNIMTCLFPEENSTLQWKRFREKQSDFVTLQTFYMLKKQHCTLKKVGNLT